MAISFNSDISPLIEHTLSHTIMAGNRLFVFNDGSSAPHQQDSTFSVYDDNGNMLLENLRMTDATDEELAGWTYFGYNLPYHTTAGHVQLHDDGGFTIHYGGSNPIVQRDNPAANPDFTAMRSFAADGTAQASQQGHLYIDPDLESTNSIIDLPDGRTATAYLDDTNPQAPSVILALQDRAPVGFAPTGEIYLNLVTAQPASIQLAVSGDRVHLFYQDRQSGDVYTRIYDFDGTQLGTETRIGGDTNLFFHRAAADSVNAATLNDGRIVLTWSNQRDGVDSSPELFQAILNADGSIARPPEIVNTDHLDGTQYDGLVFPLSDGGYVIVYHTIGGTPYTQEALARQFSSDGTPVGGTIAFEADTEAQSLNAHFAAVFPNGFGYMLDGFGTEFTISVDGQTQTVRPDPASNLTGTDSDDLLRGGNGADILTGLDGNDTLEGMDGTDTLNGGPGNDSIVGGDSDADLRDVIYGGDGDDSIDGGYGNDELRGDNGNDTISGGFGTDTVIGGAGDDVLTGQAWSDLIFGGDGDDFINGGFGYDRVNGGSGADRFYHLGVADHGSDWVQDYTAADGDVLVFGGTASADQFQLNLTETANAGGAGVEEAFVIYRPTGQILWALVDGAAQDEITLMLNGVSHDLLG
ncbi:calcium-binding protein [Thalassovita gelatinovora]|nr:calcium-binding protein [Thalassovita gelatinovora]